MRLFSGLLDERVFVEEARISDVHGELFPEEEKFVAQAVAGRRREFAAGRTCARRAMARLGFPAMALVQRSDRVPDWPAPLVGSITHDDTFCASAVARRRDGISSIGIDIEPMEPLPGELWETVLLSSELFWIEQQDSRERGILARAVFSAKESVFKCQFGVTHKMLEFEDVEIALDLACGVFAAKLTCEVEPFQEMDRFEGRIRLAHGAIASAVVISDR